MNPMDGLTEWFRHINMQKIMFGATLGAIMQGVDITVHELED
jgi:hypothetical protein